MTRKVSEQDILDKKASGQKPKTGDGNLIKPLGKEVTETPSPPIAPALDQSGSMAVFSSTMGIVLGTMNKAVSNMEALTRAVLKVAEKEPAPAAPVDQKTKHWVATVTKRNVDGFIDTIDIVGK